MLLSGRPPAIQWVADSVPAILETWFLGVEHGTAMADVLFGLYNPSGRLPAEDHHFTSKDIDVPWPPLWTSGTG